MRRINAVTIIIALALASGCGRGSSSESVPPEESGTIINAVAPAAATGNGPVTKVGTETRVATNEVRTGGTPISTEAALKPDIKFLGKGNILPTSGRYDVAFSSVGYSKARVRVRKIHQSNIIQYMQYDSYETQYNMERVSGIVADTTIVLGDINAAHLRSAKAYALSLDELMVPSPGSIYRVEIRGIDALEEENYYDNDYYFGNYETYNKRHLDLLASDLALLAKGADNEREVFAFDIRTGKPVSGARIKVYDFSQQELAKGTTNDKGCAKFPALAEARFISANWGSNFAYLDIKNEKSLSTSNFDVSGTTHENGIKTYIFGERGVWRPGDTLHISTVTMFDDVALPANHPVTAKLRNPDGQVTQTLTAKIGDGPIIHFPFTTSEDARTGRWQVEVLIGGHSFTKTLRIETIKPNKLDIGLAFNRKILSADSDCQGTIAVNWMYGAKGSGLGVECELELEPAKTSFKGYESYTFRDKARSYDGSSLSYKKMTTDEEGKCAINTALSLNTRNIPGMLNAGFTIRAFEPSGEFSTGYDSFKFSPFKIYVGLKTKFDDLSEDGDITNDRYLARGKSHKFDVVTLNPEGKLIGRHNLKAEIFLVDWSWWWSSSAQIANYMSGKALEKVFQTNVDCPEGKGSFKYDWADAPSGCYYIRISDGTEGHSAAYICSVEDYDPQGGKESGAATMLALSSDKETYKVGENARITFPSSANSHALISVEKGGKILETRECKCFDGRTEVNLGVTKEMLPNAYVSVTLIQPYGNADNDSPIRLYGIRNINVEDKNSHLEPVMDIPSEAKPESQLSFKVKEKNGRAISYVVALVDEGLLSLTGFKTPNAWDSFYAREALRVRTWDLYDNIIGAYGGQIEQLFAIGGDDEASGKLKKAKADRFTPVVKYLGPFRLDAGKTASHTVYIPQYIGSLRAMVIASDGQAQGSCQSNISITQPVMVQASLPRKLSTGETIKVPATVMALKDGVGDVKLNIKAGGALAVKGSSTGSVKLSTKGQELAYFELQASEEPGVGEAHITAQTSSDKSSHDVNIDVINPNPAVTRTMSEVIKPGKSGHFDAELFGIGDSNGVSLEISGIPAINLKDRMNYLLRYPYGCVEQTISCAFPQLYLNRVMDCDSNAVKICSRNVTAAIRKLQNFRLGNGALAYWPGNTEESLFGTIYAIHFLQEAENMGYAVPADLKKGACSYAISCIRNKGKNDYVRAYGVFALALAGKPQRGVMNLMKEDKELSPDAKWLLASAYACDGKKDVAASIISNLAYNGVPSKWNISSFGSTYRNQAIALRLYSTLGQEEKAFKALTKLAESLNDSSTWMSTQSTAWSLYAISEYIRSHSDGSLSANVSSDGKSFTMSSAKSIVRKDLDIRKGSKSLPIDVRNNGTGILYAVVSVSGIPAEGEEKAYSSDLKISAAYTDLNGTAISVDDLERGTDFKAVVTITNNSASPIQNIALSQVFPSGWEIRNDRVYKESVSLPAGIDYQDFRDDRIYSFFSLNAGQSIKVTATLTTTWPGRFYLPAISCAAMYDNSCSALIPGRWISVR